MAVIESAFSRDANGIPIWSNGIVSRKTVTYAAATTGAVGTATIFTVTGDVLARFIPVCTGSLTSGGAATLALGTEASPEQYVAATTATDIDAGEIWIETTTPAAVEDASGASTWIIANGVDVITTIAVTTITGGSITYYCLWTPLSSDGNVAAA